MNEVPEVEKLNIEEGKIIHILLKQLMYQQNEMAYIKNKMGLQQLDNGIVETNDSSKPLFKRIVENNDGSKYLSEAILAKSDGSKLLSEAIPAKSDGSKPLLKPIVETNDGSKPLLRPIVETNDGNKPLLRPIVETNDGSKPLLRPIVETNDGSKPLLRPIVETNDGSKPLLRPIVESKHSNNGNVWLYTIFEQELIKALEQYIKNGNGQNSLYGFYTDFVEAVAERNAADIKTKEAQIPIRLEETHILPAEIAVNGKSVSTLSSALSKFMPYNAPFELSEKVARELLLLHNIGKATATQLREAAGLSVGGIAKHLPKLQRAGLIKKQPPSNYVLTEKSILVLLKVFGVAKE